MFYPSHYPLSSLRWLKIFWTATIFFWASSAWGALDTIQYFTTAYGLANYVDSNIVSQAARFETQGSCLLKELVVTLGGKSNNGEAIVHIYGNEGSASYPIYQKDIVTPIKIVKSRTGIERIKILLPQEVVIEGAQFFVAVDNLSDGVTLLTGKNTPVPRCISGNDYFGWQFAKYKDGAWKASTYAYAISAVVEYPNPVETFHLTDITSSLGIADSLRNNTGLSWADVDNDTYLEFLADGRLYHNIGGTRFDDITKQSGIKGEPKAQVFIDVNNDQLIDILFIGSQDSINPVNGRLFVNQGDFLYKEQIIQLPLIINPTSVSIADADGNGFLDVYIGQYNDSINAPPYILLNQGNFRFLVDSINTNNIKFGLGSQWIPPVSLESLPYLVAKAKDSDKLIFLRNKTADIYVSDNISRELGAGLHVADIQQISEAMNLDNTATDNKQQNKLFIPQSINKLGFLNQEFSGGGAWGDVNNDGLLDLIITTPCQCRGANIYTQQKDGSFSLATHKYGLTNVPAGLDATWVDIDNNGKLDLATIVNGLIKIFKNTDDNIGNYIEVDLKGSNIIGTTVVIYSKNVRIARTVTSGRGILMQDPLRLHFGLERSSTIDSIVVNWPNGLNSSYSNIQVNRIITINQGSDNLPDILQLTSVLPNPVSTKASFEFLLSQPLSVNLTIYSLNGIRVFTENYNQVKSGVNTIEWDGRNNDGTLVPQGVYLFTLSAGNSNQHGKLTITR